MTSRLTRTAAVAIAAALGTTMEAQLPPRLPNGDYLLRWSEDGRTREARFIPADKIRPRITVRTQRATDGTFRYHYAIANEGGAEQNLNTCLFGVTAPAGFARVPDGWARVAPVESDPRIGVQMERQADGTFRGIAPGEVVAGFELAGSGRPGAIRVQCFGHEFPRIEPPDVTPGLERLLRYVPGAEPVLLDTTGPVAR